MLTLTKKKSTAPDLTSVTSLDAVPSVREADVAMRAANAMFDELAARDRALEHRTQAADALTQRQAERERRQLRPQLEEAADRAEATRLAAAATREATRRAFVDAHREMYQERLTQLCPTLTAAEGEIGAVLAWLNGLAAVCGHAPLAAWYECLPRHVFPGSTDAWRAGLKPHAGLNV